MNESDKQALGRKLVVIRAAHDKEPFRQAVIDDWMQRLRHFSWEDVERAIDEHRDHSPYVPQPSDILAILRANDGHIGPQEAWLIGKLLTDQRVSAWASGEIVEASDEVKYLIHEDPVAARKVFIEVYERLVAKARREGRAAKWQVSEGDDYRGRKTAYLQALDKKLVTREQIDRKYPEMLRDMPENNLLMDSVVKLLGESKRMGANEDDRKANAERVTRVLAELKSKIA